MCSNFGHCVFEPPLGGGLQTTYDVHLGLIGKRLVLIELFGLGVTAESLRAKRDRKSAISLQRGQFDPKFQVEGVAPHQSFLYVYSYANECLATLPLKVFTQRNFEKHCSRLSSSEVRFLRKSAVLRF